MLSSERTNRNGRDGALYVVCCILSGESRERGAHTLAPIQLHAQCYVPARQRRSVAKLMSALCCATLYAEELSRERLATALVDMRCFELRRIGDFRFDPVN